MINYEFINHIIISVTSLVIIIIETTCIHKKRKDKENVRKNIKHTYWKIKKPFISHTQKK